MSTKRFSRGGIVAVICAAMSASFVASGADQPAQPQVSKALAKPLKEAQDDLQAKKLDDALAKIKAVQALPGEKSAYDNFVINQDLLYIFVQKQDYTSAIPVLESLSQSQYGTPELQKTWFRALFGIYYQNKNYAKTVDVGQELIKRSYADNETLKTIADSQKKLGNLKEAAGTVEQITAHQDKPDENLLLFQWNCYVEAKDEGDANKVLEKLVVFYPKPDYWLNAVVPLRRMDIKDSRLELNMYRLMSDVGALRLPSDYADMAEIALNLGFPGETTSVLQEAFQKNIFTEQRNKDRYQHLLDGAKQRAAADQASLGKTTPTDGTGYVQMGAAYMTYGQYDPAIADISKGIQMGGLKSADEANLLLGIAELRNKNSAEAQKVFDKVASTSSDPGYAKLARLWALHAGAH